MSRIPVLLTLLLLATPVHAQTTHTPEDSTELATALDTAVCGDTIVLLVDVNYDKNGTVYFPAKNCGTSYITVRTLGMPAQPTSTRECAATGLARIRGTSTAGEPVIKILGGTNSGWRIASVAITKTDTATSMFGQVRFGSQDDSGGEEQETLDDVPEHLQLLGSYIYADPSQEEHRGLLLNSGQTLVQFNCFYGFHAGSDSQCISGGNGPGPYDIWDNAFHCGGEHVLFGGITPTIPGVIPSDISILRNLFETPLDWLGVHDGHIKHHLELKSAQRVLIQGNRFKNIWTGGETGISILFTTQNQDGGASCDWCVVKDVDLFENVLTNVGSGVRITGHDADHDASGIGGNIHIRNLFVQTNPSFGAGFLLHISHDPSVVTVEHVTAIQHGNILLLNDQVESMDLTALHFTDSLVRLDADSFGLNCAPNYGQDALDTCFTSYTWSGVIVGDEDDLCSFYADTTTGTTCITQAAYEAAFEDYAGDPYDGDFRLVAMSPYEGLGVDWDATFAAINGESPAGGGRPRHRLLVR